MPDFLGIGTPKSGTTWLHRNLSAHPGLFLPIKKELHYFDTNWFQPVSWYSEIFAKAGDLIKGEITPSYCALSSRRIRDVARLMPDVRLIVLLRDPVSRDWSHIRMKLLRDTGRTQDEVTEKEFSDFAVSDPLLERGNYPRIFERWLTHFDQSQLFVGLFDDIMSDPNTLMENVLAFLGVPPPYPWALMRLSSRVWEGVEAGMPSSVKQLLVARHADTLDCLTPFVRRETLDRWQMNWAD